jgi:hypothetical protein
MRHLDLELEALEERIAPGYCGGVEGSKSGGSKGTKSHGGSKSHKSDKSKSNGNSKSHGSKSGGSKAC